MSEQMVDRVANAIATQIMLEIANGEASGSFEEYPGAPKLKVRGEIDPLALAYAAIRAMREPTEAMKAVARDQYYWQKHAYGSGHHAMRELLGETPTTNWPRMIDAALALPPEPNAPAA